jgi:phosphatidylglycerol:prolipoprotein diacylglycerol transferase
LFPRLLHIGNFSLPTYGAMAALGLICGLLVVTRAARREGIDPEKAWNLGIIAILASMVGSKLLMLANDWEYYSHNWRAVFSLSTLQAYGVFYGGLITAIAACMIYIRRNRMPVARTCDVFAPGIALGHAIGRLGCFAAGCCYGKETHVPWAVTFTNPLAALWVGTPLGVPLHPTQIYEFLVELGNFFFLWWLLKRRRFDGQVIGAYLFIYGFARFFLEFLRNDPDRGSAFGGAITMVQLISILLVIAGGVVWVRGYRRLETAPAVAAAR